MTAVMKRTIIAILLLIVSGYPIFEAFGAERSPESKKSGKTYVLIVSGINKNSKERLAKDGAVTDLNRFFLDITGVNPDRLSVLVDRESTARKGSGISTAENLKEQMDRLAASVNPEDRFIFYYTGQANVVSDTLRLNLRGPDVTHEQLAEWINAIKASSMLIVLDCPGAGLAIKALTGQGRIVIGACTAEQHYSTKFSEYFVPALLDEDSDVNGDGRISLLEAFTFASKGIDDFYRQQSLLTTETPVLEDNADGTASRQPWKYEQNKTDGLAASRFFLSGE
jgi:hypothetical protein